jgi:hypothetical protein
MTFTSPGGDTPCFVEHPHLTYRVVNGIEAQIVIHKSEKKLVRFGNTSSQFYEFDHNKAKI